MPHVYNADFNSLIDLGEWIPVGVGIYRPVGPGSGSLYSISNSGISDDLTCNVIMTLQVTRGYRNCH